MRWPEKPKRGAGNKAKYDYDMVRLGLRINDLKRYGIAALMIDEYKEITEILETLNRRAHRNNLFVSGSVHTYAPMDQQRIEQFAYLLGQEMIRPVADRTAIGEAAPHNRSAGSCRSLCAPPWERRNR